MVYSVSGIFVGTPCGGVKTPPYKPTKTRCFVFDDAAECGRANFPVRYAFREVQNPSVCFADTHGLRLAHHAARLGAALAFCDRCLAAQRQRPER